MINMMRASVLFLALSYGSAVPAVQPDTSQNKKETREAGFRLVMSKNDDICTPLLAIANRYLVDSDRIPSEAQRQDLTLVSWNRVHYDDRSPSDQVIENALLDINNDGRKELVIKAVGFMHGHLTESLFVFAAGSDILSKLRPGPGGLSPLYVTPDKLDFGTKGYTLKDLPPSVKQQLMDDLKEQLSSLLKSRLLKEEDLVPAQIGGSVLQPFVWKNSVHLYMTDAHQQWVVIAKYKSGETLEDRCYFQGPVRLIPD